jgi:hypothetical protein
MPWWGIQHPPSCEASMPWHASWPCPLPLTLMTLSADKLMSWWSRSFTTSYTCVWVGGWGGGIWKQTQRHPRVMAAATASTSSAPSKQQVQGVNGLCLK